MNRSDTERRLKKDRRTCAGPFGRLGASASNNAGEEGIELLSRPSDHIPVLQDLLTIVIIVHLPCCASCILPDLNHHQPAVCPEIRRRTHGQRQQHRRRRNQYPVAAFSPPPGIRRRRVAFLQQPELQNGDIYLQAYYSTVSPMANADTITGVARVGNFLLIGGERKGAPVLGLSLYSLDDSGRATVFGSVPVDLDDPDAEDEAVGLIQSRASLWMAERYG